MLSKLCGLALGSLQLIVSEQLPTDENHGAVLKLGVLAKPAKNSVEPIEWDNSRPSCAQTLDPSVARREIGVVKSQTDRSRVAEFDVVPGQFVDGAIAAVAIDGN